MKPALVIALLLALGAASGCNRRSSAAVLGGKMEPMGTERPSPPAAPPAAAVRTISLPHDEAYAPPGPGRDAFIAACIVCHSPRYITSQPPLSRAAWSGIVKKMVDAYGAHVTAAQAAEIVTYLSATGGAHRIGDQGE